MTRPSRPAAVVAAVVAVSAVGSVLAGCSAPGRPDAGQPAASGPPAAATGASGASGAAPGPTPPAGDDPRFTARLPIAAYSYTDAQTATIDAAVAVLTDRCMRRYGLSYRAPAKPPPPARQSADRRYGLSSAFDAAHYGYHLTPDEQSPRIPAPPARSGTPQYLVLFGRPDGKHPDSTPAVSYRGRKVPAGGCRAEAQAAMSRGYDDPAASQAAGQIADGSYTASLQDPAVRNATRAWSACMRRKGYAYPTPLAALGDKAFLGAATAPREIATAEADMACKNATGLLATWFAAETRIQRGMIARQQPVLTRLRTAHAVKTAAAAKIVAAG